jgi:RNA polymerase sigma factor (sigma-70 family)
MRDGKTTRHGELVNYTLESLWQQVLDDDRSAWSELVVHYGSLVYTVALRTGLSTADAEDCGQQVWLSLYRSRRQIRDPHSLASWLIQTTRRRAIRTLQQRSNRDRSERMQAESPAPTLPDEELIHVERQAIVAQALAELDPRCRRLLQTLFLAPEPSSYAQIAKMLGLSPNALGPLRLRCLKRLKKILIKAGYDPDEEPV